MLLNMFYCFTKDEILPVIVLNDTDTRVSACFW